MALSFAAQSRLFGAWLWVGRITPGREMIPGEQAQAPLAQAINTVVRGDSQQPCRELAAGVVRSQPRIGPDKGLLGGILSLCRVPHHAIAQIEDGPLVILDQMGEGALVAAPGLGDPVLFLGVYGHGVSLGAKRAYLPGSVFNLPGRFSALAG